MNEDPEAYSFPEEESVEAMMLRLTDIDINRCPKCGRGRMVQVYDLLPGHLDYIVPNKRKEFCNTC